MSKIIAISKEKLKSKMIKYLKDNYDNIVPVLRSFGIINYLPLYKDEILKDFVDGYSKAVKNNKNLEIKTFVNDNIEKILKQYKDDFEDYLMDKSYQMMMDFCDKNNIDDHGIQGEIFDRCNNEIPQTLYDIPFDKNVDLIIEDKVNEIIDSVVKSASNIETNNEQNDTKDNTTKQDNNEQNNDIEENDTTEDSQENNNTKNNDNLYKEYNISYTKDNYEEVDKALKELKDSIEQYNAGSSNKIFINFVNKDIHAKIKQKNMIKISRLRKSAGNSIWEILRELNFDINWINNTQNNNDVVIYYEGSIDENGFNYTNKNNFIVYYDGPKTAKKITRLKKLAEETPLLPAPEEILLLPAPSNFYVILSDAIGYAIDSNASSVEEACPYIKLFNDFASAEKWLLEQKPQIINRDGNNIPDDGEVWNKYYTKLYEELYNNDKIPKIEIENYNLMINISDNKDAIEIYNKWFDKYKDLFNRG